MYILAKVVWQFGNRSSLCSPKEGPVFIVALKHGDGPVFIPAAGRLSESFHSKVQAGRCFQLILSPPGARSEGTIYCRDSTGDRTG